MRMSWACYLALLLPPAHLAAQEAPAQESPTLERGSRVRVTVESLGIENLQATYDTVRSGVLYITTDRTLRVPLESVSRFETYAGQSYGGVGTGVGWGAGVGVILGVGLGVVGSLYCQVNEGDNCFGYVPLGALVMGGIGAAIGAMSGLGAGSSDKWDEVPLERLGVGAPTARAAVSVGVSLAF
jgi:hypothetical protein